MNEAKHFWKLNYCCLYKSVINTERCFWSAKWDHPRVIDQNSDLNAHLLMLLFKRLAKRFIFDLTYKLFRHAFLLFSFLIFSWVEFANNRQQFHAKTLNNIFLIFLNGLLRRWTAARNELYFYINFRGNSLLLADSTDHN